MLAHRVGRRAHLKVVLDINTRNQIRVMERDAIVSVGAEEKRLRCACAIERRFHVAPQRRNTRLLEMPRGLVEIDVELNVRAFVETRHAGGGSCVTDTRIGERRARDFRAAVGDEFAATPSGVKLGVSAHRVEIHRRDLFAVPPSGMNTRLRRN